MRKIIVVLGFSVAACSNPTAPSTPTQYSPTQVSATWEGPLPTRSGQIVYVCETQPREYVSPTGERSLERDHYVQTTQCPSEPIK